MRIRTDSVAHFCASALLCVVFAILVPWWAAAFAAFAAGMVKEMWDKHHGGCPSWADFAWDTAGVVLGVIILFAMKI